ncbi:phage distal tail protein [Methanococcus voltae]|uniref:Siphovirus-type tail component C-terminal domain-containing protein n=1 Tax=Methanococcus voltae (strain ATCC BAA-1334 / A3) TaxID=456320 RepID=D7DSF3_METV3|nr:phage tail domain-containing protein [Methanococcus voltae]MCS3901589.1 hypothetical protein [Methanococcus voltae]
MTLYYHKEANSNIITVKVPSIPAKGSKTLLITENSEYGSFNSPNDVYNYFWKFSDISALDDWTVVSGSKDNAQFNDGIMELSSVNQFKYALNLPESYRLISRFRPNNIYCSVQLKNEAENDMLQMGDATYNSGNYQEQYYKLGQYTYVPYNLLNSNWYVQEFHLSDSKVCFYADKNPIFEQTILYNVSSLDTLYINSTGSSGLIYIDYIAIAEHFDNIQLSSVKVDNTLEITISNNNDFDLVNYQVDIDVSELNVSSNNLKIEVFEDIVPIIIFNSQQLYTSQDNFDVYAEVYCDNEINSVKVQNNQYEPQNMTKIASSQNTYALNVSLLDSVNNLKVIATNVNGATSNSNIKIVNKLNSVYEDKPVVNIIKNPAIPEITNENYINLKCEITDYDEILYVRAYSNKLSGYIELTKVEGTNTQYTCDIPLFYGDNHINIIASDIESYLGTSETIVISKNDTTPPKIVFDTMDVKCIDESYKARAKVYDDESGLKDVKIVHYGDETQIKYMEYLGNGIYEKLINLIDGENQIRIISSDNNNNELISDVKTIIKENKEIINVIKQELTPQLDIVFEKPINKVVKSDYLIECFINTNLDIDGIYAILNGNSVRLDCMGDKRYGKKVKLKEGLNNLYLQAKGQGLTKNTKKYAIYYSLKNTLKYINNDNEVIIFEKNINFEKIENVDTLIFQNIEGLNCSKMNYETKNSNNGIIINNGTLNPYNLKINGLIISKNPEILEKKISNIFSPTKSGVLYLQYDETYECPCKVCNININSNPSSKTDTVREFSIELMAEKPYWLSSKKVVDFSKGSLGFTYPLSLPLNFGQVNNRKTVLNTGYMETPVYLEINGPTNSVDDCILINNTSNEFIKLCKKLESDESVYINTEPVDVIYWNKTTGERKKAYDYVSIDSKFFNLKTGANDIELITSNPELKINIIYRLRNLTI